MVLIFLANVLQVDKDSPPQDEEMLESRDTESTESDDIQEKQDLQDFSGDDDVFVEQGSPDAEKSPANATFDAEAVITKSPEKLVSTPVVPPAADDLLALTPNLVSASTLFAPAISRQDVDASDGKTALPSVPEGNEEASQDLGKTL